MQWFVVKAAIANTNNREIFNADISKDQIVPIDQSAYEKFQNGALFLEFNSKEEWTQSGLYIESAIDSFDFWINGEKLVFDENDKNFADITAFSDNQKVLLTVTPKDTKTKHYSTLKENLPKWSYCQFKNCVIKNVQLGNDAFFGGKHLEVTISNFTASDVDGKLYGRIYEANTGELVMENNNCAYSPTNEQIKIEISLPDSDQLNPDIRYIAEVEMVDKNNNEEIVDVIRKEFSIK